MLVHVAFLSLYLQLPTVPLPTIEVERRMQMLKVTDEDGVAAVRAHVSKKKKKRKTKKAGHKYTPLSSKNPLQSEFIINLLLHVFRYSFVNGSTERYSRRNRRQ